VEELRQDVCKRLILQRQLLKTDLAFQAQQQGGSIDEEKYNMRVSFLMGQFRENRELLVQEKQHETFLKYKWAECYDRPIFTGRLL
jgi:hypothetical protein